MKKAGSPKRSRKDHETKVGRVQAPGAKRHELSSREQRLASGKALRDTVAHDHHAPWKRLTKSRDPVRILHASNRDRLPELVPIRYGRMLRSPFTFLRGSAGLMAHDLARHPSTGLRVQACGDCHLLNFGLFATPERNLVFDINDFDETLPAPWEWDVKRLAVSFAVAARDNGHSDDDARGRRRRVRARLPGTPARLFEDEPAGGLVRPPGRADLDRRGAGRQGTKVAARRWPRSPRSASANTCFPRSPRESADTAAWSISHRFCSMSPRQDAEERLREALEDYRLSLPDSCACCLIATAWRTSPSRSSASAAWARAAWSGCSSPAENHPLLLQFKEACPSVLAPYAGESVYA